MIYVIGNFILFCAIGVIVFYTNKIHHIQDENTSQLFQIFKRYSELYQAFENTQLVFNTFLFRVYLRRRR